MKIFDSASPLSPRFRKIVVFLFLTFFILLYLIQNYFFIINNTQPLVSDGHFDNSIFTFYSYLVNKDFQIRDIPYPPIVYLTTMFFYIFLGISQATALLSISSFIIIFFLSMFGIGYEMGGNLSGIAIVAISASAENILEYSRCYFLEFPQTAMTALSFYFLIKSGGFSNRRDSLLFGLSLALSMLTKWTAFAFLTFPVIYFLVPHAIKSKKAFLRLMLFLIPAIVFFTGWIWLIMNPSLAETNWWIYYILFLIIPSITALVLLRRFDREIRGEKDDGTAGIVNFGLSSLLMINVMGPWYFWNCYAVRAKYSEVVDGTGVFFQTPRLLEELFSHAFMFAPQLMLIGLIFIIFHREKRYANLSVVFNTFFLTILLLLTGDPAERYRLSLVIFQATIGGFWIGTIKYLRYVLTPVAVILSILIFGQWIPFIPIHSIAGNTPVSADIAKEHLHLYSFTTQPFNCRLDMEDFIEYLGNNRMQNPITVITFISRGNYQDLDIIYQYPVKKGFLFFPRAQYRELDLESFYSDIKNKSAMPPEDRPVKDTQFIVFFHRTDENPEGYFKDMFCLFPDKILKGKKTFNSDNTYRVTVFEIRPKE